MHLLEHANEADGIENPDEEIDLDLQEEEAIGK
jgi:hypothetical protein